MENPSPNQSSLPQPGSLKKPWVMNGYLDRILVIFQTLFILAFSYGVDSDVWVFVSMLILMSYVLVPLIYVSKFYQNYLLIKGFAQLADRKIIPRWIHKRRIPVIIAWLVIANPFIWVLISSIVAAISKAGGFYAAALFLIPWVFLEILRRREYRHISKYVE